MDSQGRAPRKQRSTTTAHIILERPIYVNQSLWVNIVYAVIHSFIILYSSLSVMFISPLSGRDSIHILKRSGKMQLVRVADCISYVRN